MKVAYYSPMPPARSGIADYSALLLPALRERVGKLVEEARSNPKHLTRALRDSIYRFMTALVGDAPGYEEAIRALYAGQREEFAAHIEAWPPDIRAKLESMCAAAFDD